MNVGVFGGVVAAFGIVVIILITILLVVVILLIKFRRKSRNIMTSSCEVKACLYQFIFSLLSSPFSSKAEDLSVQTF